MKIKLTIKFIIVVLAVMNCSCSNANASVSFIPADYSGDQKVDFADFAIVADQWLGSSSISELDRFFFHWLMDKTINPDVSVQDVYTDKSRYTSEQTSVITVKCKNDSGVSYQGELNINITSHGHTIHTDGQSVSISAGQEVTKVFPWNTPSEDFKGYLVEAWLNNGSCAVTAIDVSSDWKRYPRYGYITEFYSTTSGTRNTEIMDELSRNYHINSLQYYDWMWRHENVIQRNEFNNLLSPWIDWRGESISAAILNDSITKANNRAMAPMAYFQVFMGLDDYDTISGVSPQWGLYSDTNHANQYFHDGGVNMWLFNPANTNWRNHLLGEYTDAISTFNWAGIHLDQLGDIGAGNYNDYWGNGVDMEHSFVPFVNASKTHLEGLGSQDALTFNLVDGGVGNWAVEDVVQNGNVDFVYSELWGTESYQGINDFVKYAKANSDDKAVVFAAYVNKGEDTGGFFDTDSVLLADAAFFASGAFHLELGDGEYMLGTEFFPSRAKLVDTDLRSRLKDYYNFITAYESLLFDPDMRLGDGGLQWISTPGYSLSGSGDGYSLWFLNRATEGFEIFHLINLLENDNQWRNIADTPIVQQNVPVNLRLGHNADIAGIYFASPDYNGGIMQPLTYTSGTDSQGDYVSVTVPTLEYWDMIYIERTVNAPAGDRYEAEDAIKTYVGVNTNHSGYSGAGFVDQFSEVNDSVSFYVTVPQSGDYTFGLRYANGGANATRTLFVNGDFHDNVNFYSSGNWDSWGIATTQIYLEQGVHQVTLYYGSWNTGAINFDYLELQ